MSEVQGVAEGVEMTRELAKVMLEKVVVPLIAAGLIDMDEAIYLIKRGVVAELAGKARTQKLVASHLTRSERWVQQQLKKLKEETNEAPAAEAEPGEVRGPGYGHMIELLIPFTVRYPAAVTLEEVRESSEIDESELSDPELMDRLGLYANMGWLKPAGRDRRGRPRYEAAARLLLARSGRSRLEKLTERMSWIPPLALAHCEGKADFGGVAAELTLAALTRAQQRLREAVSTIIAEAVAETNLSEDRTVKVRAIIAIGAPGGQYEGA